MALDTVSIKDLFNQVAVGGYLGDPNGELAYAYIRVSSAQQAEEGRTGLPRQLQHCHEIAKQEHLKIPWELLFADDGFSGFEFENRPALTRLRTEIKNRPRSHHLVIEHIDRLSRNARWHQGFLLEEFTKHHVTAVFWKAFGSEIERAVLGTVAEEGMRSEISRMMAGMVIKAQSGRVTAKRPHFGYIFVDGQGQVSDKARKDTHYAVHPQEAEIVRWMYHSFIRERKSIQKISIEMNEKKIPTRFNGKLWCTGTIWRLLTDPIYKGEFYAHRFYGVETGNFDDRGRPRHAMRKRPREEWIQINVPPIVSAAEWELAQEVLKTNKKRSTRNTKTQRWLLSTFLRCDICHYAYVGVYSQRATTDPVRHYRCNGKYTERARVANSFCDSPHIRADDIEAFVWGKIEALLANPELFLKLMEEANASEDRTEDERQLAYLTEQLRDATQRFERWKLAYEGGMITLEEYGSYRHDYQKRSADLEEEQRKLQKKIGDRLSKAEQRKLILESLSELRAGLDTKRREDGEPSFEVKRLLIDQILDCIWINCKEKTIRFEGVLKATYNAAETNFVFDSNLRSQ